jgi:hypothetical protein
VTDSRVTGPTADPTTGRPGDATVEPTSGHTAGSTAGQAADTAASVSGRAAQVPLATITLLAGAVLAGGSYLGPAALVAGVAVLQGLLVISWVLGTGLPGRIGALILGALAAGGCDTVIVRWHDHGYEPVLGVLGVALPLMFIHQLTRGVVRTRVVESLADITLLLLAVTAVSGLMLLRYQANGDKTTMAVIAAMTAGLVVAHLVDAAFPALRFDPAIDRGLPAVVLGVLAGGTVGVLVLRDIIDFAGGRAAFAGAALAAVACLISIGASFAGMHSTLLPKAPRSAARPGGPAVADAVVIAVAGPADVVEGIGEDALPDSRVWTGVPRLRPVAAALITLALSTPAGYVLINALGS